MEFSVAESAYPIQFRENDARLLGEHIRHRHSVDVVGLKRVGISNFLRFFLFHKQIISTYVDKNAKHLFIPIDLNDLIERELYPFWTLTFKRIVDETEKIALPESAKQKISSTFLVAIQSQDLFLMIDGIRQSLSLLVEAGYVPTLFLLRFDRIKQAVTPEFFNNLEGLRDATHQKLAFVFTSYRSLDILSPDAMSKASLTTFSHVIYLKPLLKKDMQIIYENYQERYGLQLSPSLQRELFSLMGGDVQYLQFAFIALKERREEEISTKEDLLELLLHDERLVLQLEELWESLNAEEKESLIRISRGEILSDDEKKKVPYIFETGMVVEGKEMAIFSPLFAEYIIRFARTANRSKELVFSKKEHLLFKTLQDHLGEIRERDEIIEAVWPEYKDFGVSDWSIDRLVARVRAKLKQQESPFEIKTIRTRGYVLISKV